MRVARGVGRALAASRAIAGSLVVARTTARTTDRSATRSIARPGSRSRATARCLNGTRNNRASNSGCGSDCVVIAGIVDVDPERVGLSIASSGTKGDSRGRALRDCRPRRASDGESLHSAGGSCGECGRAEKAKSKQRTSHVSITDGRTNDKTSVGSKSEALGLSTKSP